MLSPSRLFRLLALLTLLGPAGQVWADVPGLFSFSGRLATEDGDFTGEAEITITLYDHPSSPEAEHLLWSETQTVQVEGGRFTLLLGADVENPLPDGLGQGGELYAGVAVAPDPEMVPRLPVASVPFALRSRLADRAASLDGLAAEDFATAGHGHDEAYFPRAEADTRFAAAGHGHDGSYFPRAEADTRFAAAGHGHDEAYFPRAEADARFAAAAHGHDGSYYLKGEVDLRFAPAVHDHDGSYLVRGQPDSIRGSMIVDGTIGAVDLGSMGCAQNEVLKWNGTVWACAADRFSDPGVDTLSSLHCAEGGVAKFDGSYWSCDLDLDGLGELDCTEGQLAKMLDGVWRCAPDSDTFYAPGEGLALQGQSLSVQQPVIEGWARQVCYDSRDELQGVLDGVYAMTLHQHPDHYDKSAVDGLLAGKAELFHTHDVLYYGKGAVDGLLAGKADLGHVHDLRYYTRDEANGLLAGKAELQHAHDERYYGRNAIETMLAGKADMVHGHDVLYYQKQEADQRFSPAQHAHDAAYYPKSVADSRFAAAGHAHDAAYVNTGEADSITAAMIVDGAITQDELGSFGCTTGQTLKWSEDQQAWGCAADENTTYGAGNGLQLGGANVFSLDEAVVQSLARQVCYDNEVELTELLDDDYAAAGHDHDGAYYRQVDADSRFVNAGEANSVTAAMIVDGAVGNAEIAAGAVGNTQIADAARFATVENAAGAVQFSVTDGSPALRLAAAGSATVTFAAATHTVTYTAPNQATIEGWARGVAYDTEAELTALLDDNYAASVHDHDGAYYRQAEADNRFVNSGEADSVTAAMIADGQVGNAEIADATQFLVVQSSLGAPQFAATDGNPALRFAGSGSATVTFSAANHMVTYSAPTQATIEGWARGVAYDTEAELTSLLNDNYAALGHDHHATYVNEGQVDSVTSAMITDGTILFADLGGNGCTPGQVIKRKSDN
ncbi:MAG: hypothetical protein FJ125_07205, partial [Deltaproteobacteria bacterium]|nr:hypothetical protein [Deltaproteobacteria bacterium]